MKYLEDYYLEHVSLRDVYDKIIGFDDVKNNSETLDELVLNLVIKYLQKYLGICEETINSLQRLEFVLDNNNKYSFGLFCLADIKSTAAIFREIMLSEIHNEEKNNNISISVGSGTGIDLLASIIALKRKNLKKITGYGIEKEGFPAKRSQTILSEIDPSVDFTILNKDFFSLDVEKLLKENIQNIRMFVSETIDHTTPPISVEKNDIKICSKERILSEESKDRLNEAIYNVAKANTDDPYFFIIKKMIDLFPQFFKNVKTGEIFLWPNVINETFKTQPASIVFNNLGSENKVKDIGLGNIRYIYDDYEVPETYSNRWSICL